jgi:protoporphyrinogen oxidase
VLFPRGAGVSALGVLFNGVVFEGRSKYRLETWIYGAPVGDAGVPAESDVEAAIATDRARLTGQTQSPLACYVTRRTPALPIYDSSVLAVGRQLETLPAGLALAGNYLGEIGVARLIARAERAAASLTSSRR